MATTESTRLDSSIQAPPDHRRWGLAAITPASRYYWVRLMLQTPAVLVSLGFLILISLLGILSPVIAPYDPEFVDPVARLQAPSSDHWFGTDDLGRDVFSRALYGARISLFVGVTVMIGATLLGSAI